MGHGGADFAPSFCFEPLVGESWCLGSAVFSAGGQCCEKLARYSSCRSTFERRLAVQKRNLFKAMFLVAFESISVPSESFL
jgi:hypothetical protein